MAKKRVGRFKYDQRIRRILLSDWDPIRVGHLRECQREYDSYVGGVQSLLIAGAAPAEVARYLALVESGPMGLRSSVAANMPVAKKLCALGLNAKRVVSR